MLCLAALSVQGQNQSAWKLGKYTDNNDNTVEGLISYGYSQNPKFKFKKNDSSKEVKIKASEVL